MGEVSRRDFLNSLGVTVGAAVAASAGAVISPAKAEAQPRGTIPDKPYKIGHMTFFTGAAAVLGEPLEPRVEREIVPGLPDQR